LCSWGIRWFGLFCFIMCCEILNLIKYFLQLPHVVFIDKPVIRENRACYNIKGSTWFALFSRFSLANLFARGSSALCPVTVKWYSRICFSLVELFSYSFMEDPNHRCKKIREIIHIGTFQRKFASKSLLYRYIWNQGTQFYTEKLTV
jgi:hypothetical protein